MKESYFYVVMLLCFVLDDYKTLMMSNTINSENEITTNANSNDTNVGIDRSASSARFQIEKVSNNDTNTETSSVKAISISNSMLMRIKSIII